MFAGKYKISQTSGETNVTYNKEPIEYHVIISKCGNSLNTVNDAIVIGNNGFMLLLEIVPSI